MITLPIQQKYLFCDRWMLNTERRWLKKSRSGYKNLDDQTKSDRPKIVDYEAMLLGTEVNPVSSTQRVSYKHSISQYNGARYLYDISKSFKIYRIVLHVTKYCKILDSFSCKAMFNTAFPSTSLYSSFIVVIYTGKIYTGRPGFSPKSSHTKDSKCGNWCLLA